MSEEGACKTWSGRIVHAILVGYFFYIVITSVIKLKKYNSNRLITDCLCKYIVNFSQPIGSSQTTVEVTQIARPPVITACVSEGVYHDFDVLAAGGVGNGSRIAFPEPRNASDMIADLRFTTILENG